jgi:nicotinate-nucleotide adenylyltransferase
MRIAIYGGSFNPPHLGHIDALRSAYSRFARQDASHALRDAAPQELVQGTPVNVERLELLKLATEDLRMRGSDIELKRAGKNYTSDTITELKSIYPGADFFLLLGTDMFACIESWHEFRFILESVTLAVCARSAGEDESIFEHAEHLRKTYGAKTVFVWKEPMEISSSQVRELLKNRAGREYLSEKVYERIIKMRSYGAKPEFSWLRAKAYDMLKPGRVAHVAGCEQEAVSLARRWGADEENAAEGAILHDITKKLMLDEQLLLCRKYGILIDSVESRTLKLCTQKTGRRLPGTCLELTTKYITRSCGTPTGRTDMTLLEKILYLADYIEPTRSFEGVDKLRSLAYDNIDEA